MKNQVLTKINHGLIKMMFNPTVSFEEEIDDKRIILAGNHASNFDPLILQFAINRPIHFVC